ncbi:MAG TPA: TonB-dependent receptor [Methylomirabilota bacterium]|nr:TonB-dependent receptor [Methylomirabilota bacterium]
MLRKGLRRLSLTAALWAFLLFSASDALSQPSSPSSKSEAVLFQEIPSVHGASKYKQKVTEAPSSVTIVTAEEIKKYGYRTLADLLQGVTGFFVTYDRNYNYLGVRGFNRPGDYDSRVLLLVDGHRLNDNVYESAAIGTESPIDVDLIDRVEIIRGPSSSLYGTNAFFGVINLITKRGRDIKGAELSTEVGSYESYKGRGTYGNRFQNGAELLLSGSFYDSVGQRRLFFKEFNNPLTNNGIARNADSDRAYTLFGKFSFFDVTLLGGYVGRRKGIPTAAFGTVFNTTRTRTVDEHGYLDLKYEHEFAQQWDVLARLYYDRFYYRGNYLYDQPTLMINRDVTLGEQWGAELKLTKRLFEKHKLTAGMEFRDNLHQDQRNFDTHPFQGFLHDKRGSRIWAFYLQDEFSILDNLILNAGVRHDHYDTFGGTTNPRLALIYTFKKTALKLLYGEAFRAPNAFELYYTSGPYKGNARLRPERITTYELVLERYFGESVHASVAGYYYTLDDLISQQNDPTDHLIVYKNSQAIEAKGLEVELEGKWASGLEGRIGYALQEAQDAKRNTDLTNSPEQMVQGGVIAPLPTEKLFAILETRYLDARRTLAGRKVSEIFLVNLGLFSEDLYEGLEVSGKIYNLFDERYSDPGAAEHRQDAIEQDGRTFWLKLKYQF